MLASLQLNNEPPPPPHGYDQHWRSPHLAAKELKFANFLHLRLGNGADDGTGGLSTANEVN